MAERLPFYHASRTVNEDLILRGITRHGDLVCWATEVPLEPVYLAADRVECYLADVLALYKGLDGPALVGIEVKDWGTRVGVPTARRYLRTYGRACQYFYLAAQDFTPGVFSMRDVGLFHLERREVVKAPPPLSPDPGLWRSAVARLSEVAGVPVELPAHPQQRTLPAP